MEFAAKRRSLGPRDDRRIGRSHGRPRILSRFGLRTGRYLHEDCGRTEKSIRDRLSFDEWGERRKVAQDSLESESTERHPASERTLEAGILRPNVGGRPNDQELTSRNSFTCHDVTEIA